MMVPYTASSDSDVREKRKSRDGRERGERSERSDKGERRKESKESKESREKRESRKSRESRESRESKGSGESGEYTGKGEEVVVRERGGGSEEEAGRRFKKVMEAEEKRHALLRERCASELDALRRAQEAMLKKVEEVEAEAEYVELEKESQKRGKELADSMESLRRKVERKANDVLSFSKSEEEKKRDLKALFDTTAGKLEKAGVPIAALSRARLLLSCREE